MKIRRILKSMITFVLALSMVIGLIPVQSFTTKVHADEFVEISSLDELKGAFADPKGDTYMLTTDIATDEVLTLPQDMSKKAYKKLVKLLKESGLAETVKFTRVAPKKKKK